jgi:class 3 adenylate cyclase
MLSFAGLEALSAFLTIASSASTYISLRPDKAPSIICDTQLGPLPLERRIDFRIGVPLGDVVEESDGDLMGDGVNIAARLEGIARPSAICLSEDAYRQVKARLDLAVRDLGENAT